MTKKEIEDYKARFPNRKYYIGEDGREFILDEKLLEVIK